MGNRGGKEREVGVEEVNDYGKLVKRRRARGKLPVPSGSGDKNIRDGRQENQNTEERPRGAKAQRGAREGAVIGGRLGDGGVDTVSRKWRMGRTSVEDVGQGDGGADVKQEKKGRSTGAVQERDVRGRDKGAAGVRGGRQEQIATLTQDEYLQLLKCLNVKLPEGVLTQRVMELVGTESSIRDAKAILRDLESFLVQFKAVPRLACRDVKHHLNLKRDRQILQLTKLLFFEKEDNKERRQEQWRRNKTNTGRGFRLREKYIMDDTAISTPAMYSTAVTRSRRKLKVEEDCSTVSKGTRVNMADVERKDYTDESKLWKNGKPSGAGRFGMFSVNKRDELEMLKFFHELGELKKGVTYSKGNKVEYGFLSGNIDFLVQIKPNSFQRLVIECKSTTGDMIGKLFTKIPNSVRARIDQSHDYSFQVQAYMYILNMEARAKNFLQMKKAVMVVRHYHQEGTPPRDFCWNYLQIDLSIQDQIEELRMLCQEEVLARYLALLNLIFQKDTVSS